MANRVPSMSLFANPPPQMLPLKAPEPSHNTTTDSTASPTIVAMDDRAIAPSAPPAAAASTSSAAASASAASPVHLTPSAIQSVMHTQPHPQPPVFGNTQIPAALLSALASAMAGSGGAAMPEGLPPAFLPALPNQPTHSQHAQSLDQLQAKTNH